VELKDWIERLLEYTQLTEDDIKKVCEADKRRSELFETLGIFSKIGGYF
jgi:hypothetical protein